MAGVGRGPVAEQTYTENMAWALDQAPSQKLVVEPLNVDDMPGYFLNDFDQASRILTDIGNPRLGLQFDVWHAAKIHGDAWNVWETHRDQISHVQIAGFPNRAEPGGGGFDLTALFRDLDARGYLGWVAAQIKALGLIFFVVTDGAKFGKVVLELS